MDPIPKGFLFRQNSKLRSGGA